VSKLLQLGMLVRNVETKNIPTTRLKWAEHLIKLPGLEPFVMIWGRKK
jgi:hypothetical protein